MGGGEARLGRRRDGRMHSSRLPLEPSTCKRASHHHPTPIVRATLRLHGKAAAHVLKTTMMAGNRALFSPKTFAHASRYDLAPTSAETLAMREKVYAETAHMKSMRPTAGTMATWAGVKGALVCCGSR